MMMKLGIILHKIPDTNIFIVDIGWGQLRYFSSNDNYKEKDIILCNNWNDIPDIEGFDWTAIKATYGTSDSSNTIYESYDDNEIEFEVVGSIDDCEFLGNVRYDFHPNTSTKLNIAIERKDSFICWKKDEYDLSYRSAHEFDLISNSLLFLSYAEPRYPYPDKKEWLEAYIYAKKKVEELDILKMIEELKVEYHKNCWTRRGSDNVLFSNRHFEYGYKYHYSYLHDYYLDTIFPEYYEPLYSSKDDDCTYIHPKYKKWEVIRTPEGYNEFIEETFNGLSIEEFCTQKTNELRQVALKNYESYNKDEHITSIAYNHINWYNIKEENKLFQKMIGLAKIVWSYDHKKILKQITQENYKELIQSNNANHPIPKLPDDK